MKLLPHSNVVYKLQKDRVRKRIVLKNFVIFFIGLLVVGALIQVITNIVDNTRLKSRFKYVRIDGNKMEYKFKSGENYTVVFDGSIGTNMYEWDKICKSLEEKNTSTFIYNRRGYGFNDGGDIRTPEEQAKDLKILLKKVGASEPYVLVGEEYGSLVITNFINLYPSSVAGAVLVEPLSEEKIKTDEFKKSIKADYYRSKFEAIGTNLSLTYLLSKMGLTMENNVFKDNIAESELEEYNIFKNKNKYKQAVYNELTNVYKNVSNSQRNGLLSNKPFYLITKDEEDPIKKIGDITSTTVYKEEIYGSPISLLDPDIIVNGVNSVLNDVKKKIKKTQT
jgi:hypothetical protein